MKRVMLTMSATLCAVGLWAAEQKSLVVTTAADVVNPNDNLISLREAVSYAIADAGAGTHPLLGTDGAYTITFGNEVFTESKATIEFLASLGQISISANKFGTNPLVIQAPGNNAKCVSLNGGGKINGGTKVNAGSPGFSIESGNVVTFRNINFESFYRNGTGAAIKITNAQLEVENCSFWDNKATGFGGAVWAQGGFMKFRDCTFGGNKSASGGGGAVYLDGTKVLMINAIVNGSNGYYACGAYEGSYSTGAAFHLANAAELRLGNASFFGNSSGDVFVDASAAKFYCVNSFFFGDGNVSNNKNLKLDSATSGATVRLANCLVNRMDDNFAAVSDPVSTACAKGVDKYYVYGNVNNRIARGVTHLTYDPQDFCLGTGVAVMSDVGNPFAGFGFRRVLDDAVDKEQLIAGSLTGPTGYDIFHTLFLPSGSDKAAIRNCTIGAVHANSPVNYELSTGYDPNFDVAPSAGAAFVKKLVTGSVLPGIFLMPPICSGRTVEGLCEYLFQDHAELENFKTGDYVKYVDGIFDGCTGLTSVTLGRAVSLCDGYTFSGAPNLTEIDVSYENTVYKSENGILYTVSGSDLVRVPEGAEVPEGFLDGVLYITYTSMDGCTRMGESLVIPDSVISIDDGALCNIPGLKTLEIGTGLVSFGTLGFAPTLANLPALESVLFRNPGIKVHANEFTDLPALTTVDVVPANPAEVFTGWRKVLDPTQVWLGHGTAAFGSSNDYMLEPRFDVPVTLTFEANGGTAVAPLVEGAGVPIQAPSDPVREGYVFGGWFADADLTAAYAFVEMPAADTTVYAKWTAVVYPIAYVLDGGVNAPGNPATYTIEDAFGLASPTRDRYVFTGWSPSGSVAAGTTGPLTFTANWTKAAPDLYATPADTPFMGDATYSGWIRDENGGLKGLVTVKAGKGSKPAAGGQSKLTVTYTPVGGKKITVKPVPLVATNQVAEVTIPNVGTFNLGGLSAASGTADIQLGKDLSKEKDPAAKARVKSRTEARNGVWTFALRTELGDAGFSLSVKKGKGKLTGVLPNGDKVSVSAKGILGEDAMAFPFVYSKKASFGLVFWIMEDGTAVVSDVTAARMGGVSYAAEPVEPGTLSAAKLSAGGATFKAGDYEQAFTVGTKKWDAGKGAAVNPNGLALKYAPKTGLVTGSFKNGGMTLLVEGAVVEGVFYGAVYSKTRPGVAATVE